MNTHSLAERIELVERKLTLRRKRTGRHWLELRAEMTRRTRWVPLAGVVALGVLAFLVSYRNTGTGGRAARHATGRHHPLAAGGLATVLAAVATAARIAMSPQAHHLWNAWRTPAPPEDSRATEPLRPDGQKTASGQDVSMAGRR